MAVTAFYQPSPDEKEKLKWKVNDDDNHDNHALYIITNIPGIKFQTRTKHIINMKYLNLKDYIYSFKTLPLSIVYSFDDSINN